MFQGIFDKIQQVKINPTNENEKLNLWKRDV